MADHDPVVITWVAVPLSQAELRRYMRQRHFTAPGELWSVMRQAMGLQHSPINVAKPTAVHRLLHPEGHFVVLDQEPTS